jgi:hypothetical protein
MEREVACSGGMETELKREGGRVEGGWVGKGGKRANVVRYDRNGRVFGGRDTQSRELVYWHHLPLWTGKRSCIDQNTM